MMISSQVTFTITFSKEGEDFSSKKDKPVGKPKDIEMLKDLKVPGYLLTLSGDIKKYDPNSDKTTTIGHCK
jgi:hypothetical protein